MRASLNATGAVVIAILALWRGEAAAATIYGTLTENGKPIANQQVRLICNGGASDQRESDTQGNYQLRVPKADRCKLTVRNASADVFAYDGEPTKYSFDLSNGRLTKR